MMAVDGGVGVHAKEDDEQVVEGAFLFGRAGVLRSEVVVEATHIADADGVLVVFSDKTLAFLAIPKLKINDKAI